MSKKINSYDVQEVLEKKMEKEIKEYVGNQKFSPRDQGFLVGFLMGHKDEIVRILNYRDRFYDTYIDLIKSG